TFLALCYTTILTIIYIQILAIKTRTTRSIVITFSTLRHTFKSINFEFCNSKRFYKSVIIFIYFIRNCNIKYSIISLKIKISLLVFFFYKFSGTQYLKSKNFLQCCSKNSIYFKIQKFNLQIPMINHYILKVD
ncbi:hypothetical protein IMG5_007000, partial [Ichthyophthirius multifiliis]